MKCFVVLLVAMSAPAVAQEIDHVDASTPREFQIRLAKSAAPKEVSESADIYVLTKKGYELAVKGSNGFSCLIERERPDTMEPECYDDEGTQTTLKVRVFIERQRANGVSEEQIERSVKDGYESRKFRPPSKPGIVYMLSDHNHVLNPETHEVFIFPGI